MNFILTLFSSIRTRIKDIYCKAEEGQIPKCTQPFPLRDIKIV